MPLPSILAVLAHPDDESLATGGVLAKHAVSGARTGVVTATWAPGTHRVVELAAALRALGAGEPRLLGYADHKVPDSAPTAPRLCDAPLDEAIGRVVAQLRAFQPDLVITHGPAGESGHPDHIRTHQIITLAVHACGLDELHPDAGPPWTPSALYLCAHPHTGARPLAELVASAGKRLRTVPDERADTVVDVRPWVRSKWEAIQARRSEIARSRSLPALLAGLGDRDREDVLATEWFTRHGLLSGDTRAELAT